MAFVREHMQTNLVIVPPGESLVAVSRELNHRRVAAALIVDDGNLAGILTERDIVRAVAVGADLETSPSEDFMSRMLTTVLADAEMADAAEIMVSQQIRHLPVLDDGRLVGMLSLRDVARWSLHELGYDARHHLARLVDLSA
jgi:CBS domain-containing protein